MSLSDTSTTAALAAAQDKIRAAAAGIVVDVANSLLMQMKSASTYRERGQIAFAQIHILESRELFLASFASALRDSIAEDVGARSGPAADKAKTDWQSISLVGEDQIEERISFGRIGQVISHSSEAELRELDGYMNALLQTGWADPDRNPLRGAVLGLALHKAIEKITDEPGTQKIFARELGQAMAAAMPACYQAIIADLRQRGVRATDLGMRPADSFGARPPARPPAPGPAGPGPAFDEARKAWEVSWQGRIGAETPGGTRDWERSILGRHSDPISESGDPESSAGLLDRLIRGAMPASFGAAQGVPRAVGTAEADVELMSLLRRLNGSVSMRGELDSARDSSYGPYTREGDADFTASTRPGVPLGAYQVQAPSSGLSGLMAANLIRAHRDELMQASRGKLDHLVIEVVSSLFDQILSDARVPPQMARQIARLQLPVLRAALVDSSFFSSRRHPVRRFINRIASLACAFDSFETGPARELLDRISGLVKEIVDGDFDQLQTYDAKLLELERFVAEQTHAEIRESSAAATLRGKELEWRVQKRFSQRLFAALEPLALPAFLRDFLAGVWGQAIVMASRRDGAESTHAQSLRRTGVALVTSIQPKRSLEERKQFVVALARADVRAHRGHEVRGVAACGAGRVLRPADLAALGLAQGHRPQRPRPQHAGAHAGGRIPPARAEPRGGRGRARARAGRGGDSGRRAALLGGRRKGDRPDLRGRDRLVAPSGERGARGARQARCRGAGRCRARAAGGSVGIGRHRARRRRRRRGAVSRAAARRSRRERAVVSCARSLDRGAGRISRARRRSAVARPSPARLLVPAQSQGSVGEGSPDLHEPRVARSSCSPTV